MPTLRVPVLALAVTALVGGGFAAGIGVMQLSDSTPDAQSVVLAGANVSGSSATSVPCPVATTKPAKKPVATTSPASKATKSATPTASASKPPAGKTPPGKVTGFVVDGFAALGAGTTGGAAGETVTVTTTAALAQYAGAEKPLVIKVSGLLTVSGQIKVAANKTIVGVGSGSGLTGGGLNVRNVKNVIIANLTISKAKGTDAVSVFGSNHVLVTHNDFSSDRMHGKDFYDGLVDITQGSDDVTVSFNRFHDHFKVVLIGHSDDNGALDTGKLHVTLHHNSFTDVGSRLPSLRFGTGHVYNNVFTNVETSAIHSRMGAVILAQNNVFTKVKNAYVTNADSKEPGTILTDPSPVPAWPYSFTLDATSKVAANVATQAGPK
jgi:pectate lyase